MRTAPPGLPWYQRPVVIILALVFVAPLGIGLLWWRKLWSERTRIMASVASGVLFLAMMFRSGDSARQLPMEGSPMATKPSSASPDATSPAVMPAHASDSPGEIERSCGLVHGERPRFVKRKLERYDNVNIPRVQVRI